MSEILNGNPIDIEETAAQVEDTNLEPVAQEETAAPRGCGSTG
jgi:hypothetical protein